MSSNILFRIKNELWARGINDSFQVIEEAKKRTLKYRAMKL